MIIDGNGLICSKDWAGGIDHGDTLAETGRIYFLKKLCNIEDSLMPFEDAVKLLHNADGKWIRAPEQWTDPKDVSRDQLDPIAMCGELYQYHLKPVWFYPNWDIASPEHRSHFFRYRKNYLADLFMLLNTLIICFVTARFRSQVKNDLNHIISLCFAENAGHTFISRFAARAYLRFRDYKWALLNYYTPQSGNGDAVKYYLAGLTWLSSKV